MLTIPGALAFGITHPTNYELRTIYISSCTLNFLADLLSLRGDRHQD
ncbi:hypothetical protein [Nodularia sphaerocarpa]|nr:hypothetical protein [Nodularia sphaerocarpa]MDB9375833.1 hypothetical protein [Nodularia sphaerocarpa CS-585]MDB9377071.1 hypothetical protein [Nodularia sphaerocarpa CS-585A2]